MRVFAVFLSLWAACGAIRRVGLEAEVATGKLSAVQKVVAMLKDMQNNLQKEYDEDEKTFKKIACWCHNNKLDKKFEIEDGEILVGQLTDTIKELEGKKKESEAAIAQAKKEIAENTEELNKAQAVRDEQLKKFRANENECTVNVEALKNAVTILSRVNPAAKDETKALKDKFENNNMGPDTKFMQAKVMAPAQLSQLRKIVTSGFDKNTADKVVSMLQSPFGDYSAQSGEILGILKQMEVEMTKDCGEAAQEEAQRAEQFAELKAAKEEQIATARKTKETQEDELAQTNQDLAKNNLELDDAQEKLEADRAFMEVVNKQCKDTDGAWEERKKARMEEMTAVRETIEILTSEEARDAIHKTHAPGKSAQQEASEAAAKERGYGADANSAVGFVQLSIEARERVAAMIRKVALKSKNTALLTLAMTVKLDAFTKVKKAINDMIDTLKQQQEDEVKFKDACVKDINDNEAAQADNLRAIDLKEKEIAENEANIKGLKEKLASLQKELADTKVSLQQASADRVEASVDYQTTVADQQATQKVIKMALERMLKFYNKGSSLAQTVQQPPAKFQEYKPSGASSPVISMLRDLIQDAKRVQTEAHEAEQKAWNEYNDFINATNQAMSELENNIANTDKEIAEAEELLIQQQDELKNLNEEKEALIQKNGDLHGECDFILNNFDTRQENRNEEMEALREALGILAGALQQ
jgi:chromosome segregation ATPase